MADRLVFSLRRMILSFFGGFRFFGKILFIDSYQLTAFPCNPLGVFHEGFADGPFCDGCAFDNCFALDDDAKAGVRKEDVIQSFVVVWQNRNREKLRYFLPCDCRTDSLCIQEVCIYYGQRKSCHSSEGYKYRKNQWSIYRL